MKKWGWAACLLLGAAGVLSWGQPAYAAAEEPVVEEGVYAGEVEVSGMTREEALAAVNSYYQELAASPFTVTADGQPVETTLAELGFSWDAESVVDAALREGKTGGILARYKEKQDLQHSNVVLEIPYTLDSKAVAAFVGVEVAALDTPPVDASITREDGAFVITPEVNGLVTNKVETVKAVEQAVADRLEAGMTVEAVAEVTTPACTAEVLGQIQDLLGDKTTDVSGTDARYTNVRVGSGNIDGTVLMPGESASASDMMKSRTPENGYKKATQYVSGRSEEAYGGGVCQVSSTLYVALLEAELQIDERHPHSMTVSYLDPSFDAAIAQGAKDLKFTNNTEYPIYIEAICSNRKLTFNIYGVEDRPANREVVYESTTVYKNWAPDIVKYDPTLPVGYRSATGDRHPNLKSYLEKVVYVDGVEVSRERLHTDTYSASVKTIVEGTAPVAPDPTVPVDPNTPANPGSGTADPGSGSTNPGTGTTNPGTADDPGTATDPGTAADPGTQPAEETTTAA